MRTTLTLFLFQIVLAGCSQRDTVTSKSEYYLGGDLHHKTYFNNQTAVREIYYFENGKVSVERSLNGELFNGLETQYFNNGAVYEIGHYCSGNPCGRWTYYHPNGKVYMQGNFNPPANKSQGLDTFFINLYDPDETQGHYGHMNVAIPTLSRKDGVWNYYDVSGALICTEEYKEGLLISNGEDCSEKSFK